jgi:hypothetical protein
VDSSNPYDNVQDVDDSVLAGKFCPKRERIPIEHFCCCVASKVNLGVYVCMESFDLPLAQKIQEALSAKGVNVSLASPSNVQQNSTNILKSYFFIFILSPKSSSSTRLRDQLALAENHKKILIPIFTSREVKLDPAMQYTLAKAPAFFIDDEHYLEQLELLFRIQGEANQMVEVVSQLQKKYEALDLKLKQKIEQRNKLKSAYVIALN